LVGGFWLLDFLLLGCIEESFLWWFEGLFDEMWFLFLVVVVELFGDFVLMWCAVSEFGIVGMVLELVMCIGLMDVGACVCFWYPFVWLG